MVLARSQWIAIEGWTPERRTGEHIALAAFPLKEMSRGVAHSKTRDNQLPNPAVIQEPPLSKERPIWRTVATGSVL
jgi:hypothetical protein